MPGTTPNGYSYPLGNDFVRDGDDMIANLAKALDPTPAVAAVTVATGWSASTGPRAVRIGPLVHWILDMTRTGAPIVCSGTGKIVGGIPVFTGLPANYRPVNGGSPTSAWVECVQNAEHNLYGYVDQAGSCVLTHGWPSQTYDATAGYRFRGLYLLGF